MGFFSAVKRFFGQEEEPEKKGQEKLNIELPQEEQETISQSRAETEEQSQDTITQENEPDRETPEAMPPMPGTEHGQSGKIEVAAENESGPEDTSAEPVGRDTETVPEQTPALEPDDSAKHDNSITMELEEQKAGSKTGQPQATDEPAIDQTEIEAKALEKNESAAIASGQMDFAEKQDSPATGEQPGQSVTLAETKIIADSDADKELILRLRQAEPRLSNWLAIILEGQEKVEPVFWERLKFLLTSLEAPEAEANAFLADFRTWLERMEYEYIDEFRSELQYRLALALDLEDEEDERNRLLLKLSHGLAATREQFGRRLDALFASHGELSEQFWEEMEELFIMADLGYETSLKIVERLKKRAAQQKVTKAEDARGLLQAELAEIFKTQPRIKAVNKPEVVLMMGVNGAGKTTTIAKLAHRDKMSGKKVLVAAADTFRAAAIEQLQVWAQRAGVDFYAKPAGSDPASVAWEAMDYALKNDIDIIYVDTAGRLQTRVNLMEELGKIRQVLAKKHPGAPHRSMLVLDATTGQNALSQAKLFKEAAGADEIALTKLDGTAKGGVAIAVAMQENLPISFIGLGEKMEDLRPFNGPDFANALLQGQP